MNSSLRARVRVMKPIEKARPPSSLLAVMLSTSSSASTPAPMTRPPSRPVEIRPDQERPRRCSPSSTSRSKERSVSCWATSGSVASRALIASA